MSNVLTKLFTNPKDEEAAVNAELAAIQERLHKATARKNDAAGIIEKRAPAKVAGDGQAAADIAQARADLAEAEKEISELRLAAKAKQAELAGFQARKLEAARGVKIRLFRKLAQDRMKRISDIDYHVRELARQLESSHNDAAKMRTMAAEIWGKDKRWRPSSHDWPLGRQSVESRLMEFGAHLGLDKALDYFAGSVRISKGADFHAWEREVQSAWIKQFDDQAKAEAGQGDSPQVA
jgi:chromosome segregation ATPase